ncbi:translation initiation factor 3 subunit M, partial [Acrasis kona]
KLDDRKTVRKNTNNKLYTLLTIVGSGTYEDYIKFSSTNDVQQISGINKDNLTTKMRVVGLCELCNGRSELSYGDISNKLQITEDEVEDYVIRALSAKLIEARLNQLEKKVYIIKSVQRNFGDEQWKQLQSLLAEWKQSVTSVQKTIQQNALKQ